MSQPTHRLDALVHAHLDRLVALRQDLHAHPELGYEERRTAELVEGILRDSGYAPWRPVETGVVADTGRGEAVALRAELDALAVREDSGVSYASKLPGRMHACGHDGHTAVLVGVALALAPVRDKLPANVRFVFQPAEEGLGGARRMIEGGALDGVSRIFGLHNWPQLRFGKLAVRPGAVMASSARFEVTVHGRGGHASQPSRVKDPVLAACNCVSQLQALVSRETDYARPAVLSVTTIHGGTAHNVVPDSVTFVGTIRAWDEAQADTLGQRVEEMCTAIASAHGCRALTRYERYYPVVRNHPAETAIVQEVGAELLGDGAVTDEGLPMMGAEDFAFYLERTPGAFFFLGAGRGSDDPVCHSSRFDFNDDLILPAVRCFLRIVERVTGATLA